MSTKRRSSGGRQAEADTGTRTALSLRLSKSSST